MADEKAKKVSLDTQIEQSNINEYEKEQLVEMVNSTSSDADFATTYPDATFSRTLAYKYLGKKYDMDFIGRSYVIPHGVTISDLIEAYEKQNGCNSDANKEQDCENGVDTIEVIIGAKKGRSTFSMSEDTMQRWSNYVKDIPNKSDYLSAACDLFIKRMDAGKVEMKPVFLKPGTTKEM